MATASTIPHELHRKRRAAISNFFSKASIRRLEPIMRDAITLLLNRMDMCGKSGEVMPMDIVYKAFTCDVITTYAFGKSTDFLTREDYNRAYFETFDQVFETFHFFIHIGWLSSLMRALPISILLRLIPTIGSLFQIRQVSIAIQISTARFS